MSFHTNALSARANLPYQTGGIEKILQMIAGNPLARSVDGDLSPCIYSKSLTCLLISVGCSLQHPATLPTSPNISQFRCLSKGWRHTEHIWSRPPWHRLGWPVVPRLHNVGRPLKLLRLTNFGIFSKSTDQLWNPNESTHFCSVNPQHLAGFKSISKKTKAEI